MPRLPTVIWAMIPAKPWTLEAVAHLFLGVIMTLFGGSILAGIVQTVRFGFAPATVHFLQMTIMVLFFQGAALVWIGIFLHRSKISWREAFGLRPASTIAVVLAGLASGVVFLPVAWLAQIISQMLMEFAHIKVVEQSAVAELQNAALNGPEKILLGVFTILLAPIAEESLFRGILYPALKQTGRPRLALWVTSLLFGLLHMNMAIFAPLVLLALLLTYLYESSGSLLAPIAAHGVFNAVNYLYLLFADSFSRLPHLP
jgi:membrane protease YdiL (CAAX protease family)